MPMTPETRLAIEDYRKQYPSYASLSDESLYHELKQGNSSLSWAELDAEESKPVDTSPTFLNSFQSWLDGPISEDSWN